MNSDVIRMALDAGMHLSGEEGKLPHWVCPMHILERFATLIREQEREACAMLCQDRAEGWSNRLPCLDYVPKMAAKGEAECLAAAIRARGETK